MKKTIAFSVLGFIICTAFNKPAKLVTDYRDAYTGTYFCQSFSQHRENDIHQTSTRVDTSRVMISKDVKDSILQVKANGVIFKMKLLNKRLRSYTLGVQCGGYFFSADSLDFRFALNRASNNRYRGKKM